MKQTIKDIDVSGKKVFVRVDFNVPLDANGNITDDRRIVETLPTINYLVSKNAKVIIASHLGRPKGFDKKLQMDKIAKRLSELLQKPVKKTDDCIGEKVDTEVSSLAEGDVLVLENIRFRPEEEKNDENFAKSLAKYADIYVNDAFATMHRAHASTYGIAKYLPAVAGLLVEKELKMLSQILEEPERPFVTILGGAKVSDKLGLLKNLVKKVDKLLIGGGMAFTFLQASGYKVGKSIVETTLLEDAKQLISDCNKSGILLCLPKDVVIGNKFAEDAEYRIVDIDSIPSDWYGLDIGPKTISDFCSHIRNAKTIFWNGPLGVFEWHNFSKGTASIASEFAHSTARTIIGGGDTAAALKQTGFESKVTHISTGGGAALKFLEGKKLPGLDVLLEK
jgi:phosphoglycerate kinase